MKRILSFLIAAVMSVTALTACGSDDISSQADKKTEASESSGRTALGKAAAGAALGIGALILIPSMVGYAKKSQQASANAAAKTLYIAVRTTLADLEAEGKPAKSNFEGKKVKLSKLKNSTEFDKQIYSYLNTDSGDDPLIFFEFDGYNVSYVTWQKNESAPVGAYPLDR